MSTHEGPSILVVHRSSPVDYGIVLTWAQAEERRLLESWRDHGVVFESAKVLLGLLVAIDKAPEIVESRHLDKIRDYRTR